MAEGATFDLLESSRTSANLRPSACSDRCIKQMAIPLHHEMRTRRLTLRRLTVTDSPRIHEIQSNWNVTRMLSMAAFPPTRDSVHRWLSLHEDEWMSGTAYRFAVVLDGEVIGCADIDEISSNSGELGYWLDEAYWGRGIASEAATAVLSFGFGTVGLQRLLSGHAADNRASGRILTKLGFRPTGQRTLWSQSRQTQIVQRQFELDAPSDRARQTVGQ